MKEFYGSITKSEEVWGIPAGTPYLIQLMELFNLDIINTDHSFTYIGSEEEQLIKLYIANLDNEHQ